MKKIVTIFFLIVMYCGYSLAQTTTIDFETDGSGYTPSSTEGSGSTDVFNRVNPNIGGNSTYFWACEDISLSDPCITIDQIDITSATSFNLSVDFLTPNSNDWDTADELLITYCIDGGTYQNLMHVQSNSDGDNYNAPAAIDTDFDGDGDDGQELPAITDEFGAGVGSTFETFTSSDISVSGNSTLDIVLQFNGLTSGGEGIYIDNITITQSTGSTTPDPEPTNQATNFSATASSSSQIDLTWIDATGDNLPAGYLILANETGSFTDPVDGTDPSEDTDLSDGSATVKVDHGDQTYSFTGLNASTQYYFKIWSYSNSSTTIDFKTDGTVPTDDATTDDAPAVPNAWINEIHYDNSGSDENEGIEVVVENPTNDMLGLLRIDLYNGNNGESYNDELLSGFSYSAINDDNNFRYFYLMISGIQNGNPDGIALSYDGTLIQFLSYGGTFAATEGAANGITSTDIGVSESGSTVSNTSLQLLYNGTEYDDFSWTSGNTQTWGEKNSDGETDQSLPVTLSSFTATNNNGTVVLNWTTESEVNNMGFNLYKSEFIDGEFVKINEFIIEGAGNSSVKNDYTYTDTEVITGHTYYYQIEDIAYDGDTEKHDIISITIAEQTNTGADDFQLMPAYPNPCNPSTTIQFTIPEDAKVNIIVYDIRGQLVKSLVAENRTAGNYEVNWNGTDMNNSTVGNGVYFYQMTTNKGFTKTEKVILLK